MRRRRGRAIRRLAAGLLALGLGAAAGTLEAASRRSSDSQPVRVTRRQG